MNHFDLRKAPKILVTGAAGFIGMHTVLKLMRYGYEVVGLDNMNTYYSTELKLARLEQTGIFTRQLTEGELIKSDRFPFYSFIKLTTEDKSALLDLFARERFDFVIHLAAQAGVRHSLSDPDSYIGSNILGFMNILECCRQFPVNHLVYASSSSVYGLNPEAPFTENSDTDHPASLYAATKKANEVMAHSYSHLFNLPTTGLRFFTVYGPWGRPDMALSLFTQAILEDQPIRVFNHGHLLRDFTYIDDIVEVITRVTFLVAQADRNWNGKEVSSSSAPYRLLNVGNGNPASLIEYITAIENCLHKKAVKQMLPMQPGDMLMTHADTSRLQSCLDFKPSVPLQAGVKQFVDWYVSYYGRKQERYAHSQNLASDFILQ